MTATDVSLDTVYQERDLVLALMFKLLHDNGFIVWRGVTPEFEAGWQNCVYAMLPLGQVSWHIKDDELFLFAYLPTEGAPWDGHDTPEKYRRLLASVQVFSFRGVS